MAENSLAHKTTNGVLWNFIDRIINYGISFFIGVILARLLSPEEYGIIGIIGIFTAIFNIILDGGLSTALIRKDSVSDIDYCTVFYSNIGISFLLTFLLYWLSYPISAFFKRPELIPYIQVMSLILIINALSLTQQVKLTKKIDFKSQAKISLFSQASSGCLGIYLAIKGYGVWSLVFQQLSSRLLISILLWCVNKWIPKLQFSWQSFKELFNYGWKLLIAQVIGSFWTQIYQVVIGKIYSPTTLGQYTRANQYTLLCSSTIADVIMKVSLPVMSKIQNDDERLLRAFRIIIKVSMLISAILLFWMAAAAHSLIIVLIGDKWEDCVPMMQILCFYFILIPLHQINLNMLIVQGRSDIQLLLQIIKCILAVGPIALGVYCGIYWMLFGSVVVGWTGLLLNSYYSGKKFGYSWYDQLKDVIPSILIAFMISVPVYFLSFLDLSCFIILPLQIVVGLVLTVGLNELFKREEYLFVKNIIITRL